MNLDSEDRIDLADRRWRLILAVLCAVLVSVPLLATRFPPITDLPQHAAQVRLLLETLDDPQTPYRVQWLTPYSLVYLVVGAAWRLFGPMAAGRLALVALAVLWVLAAHALAAAWRRPASTAVLASVLCYSNALYWGFYSFLLGWPVFVVWLLLTRRLRRRAFRWREMALLVPLAAVLYFTHALWAGVAGLWLVVSAFAARVPWRDTLRRALCFLPLVPAAVLWYPALAASGFVSPTLYLQLWERLTPGHLVDSVFGGLAGPTEAVMVLALLGWGLLALWQHRDDLRPAVSRELLLLAAMLFALAFLLPDLYSNTILFARRWMPLAVLVALLGLPAPRLRPRLRRLAATAVAVAFYLGTTAAWMVFERVEYTGFDAALAALPEEPRVIGLAFEPKSSLTKHFPFLQSFAYAQVLRGGELNFSFADFAPSLVVYRRWRTAPGWQRGLEWFPKNVRPSDLAYFDYALVRGKEPLHRSFAGIFPAEPVTGEGLWRLYRVTEAAPDGDAIAAP